MDIFKDPLMNGVKEAAAKAIWDYVNLGAKRRRRKIEVTITPIQLLEIAYNACAYCGTQPTKEYHGIRCSGVDRVDSKKGYTLENCVPCCWPCNRAKGTQTKAEFLALVQRIYTFQKAGKPGPLWHENPANPLVDMEIAETPAIGNVTQVSQSMSHNPNHVAATSRRPRFTTRALLSEAHLNALYWEGLKWCPKCKNAKTKSFFGKDRNRHDGLSGVCKECRRRYMRDTRQKQEHSLNAS